MLLGARTYGDVLFADDFNGFGETFIATDDGSAGYKGSVVELLKTKLESGEFKDADFYICGPEPMMVAAAKLLAEYTEPSKIYLGLERYMSCGVGLCGKCALDGYRTCVDGPVMRLDLLGFDGDFGKQTRGKSGNRHYIV